MQKSSVEAIVKALNEHQVKYLVVGGLAVVAHGYVRFTAAVDLMLGVDEGNLRRAVEALKGLGYRPRAPVAIEEFLDSDKRKQWATEKSMTVFSLYSDQQRMTEVDLFLEPPIDFGKAYGRAYHYEVAPGVTATFCGLDDLIEMKAKAGRPVDQQDIEKLQKARKSKS